MRRSRLLWMGAAALLYTLCAAPAHTVCLWGSSVATYQYDGPYGALYLYTIELHFDLPKGLSNVSLKLNVTDCPELACQQIFYFPMPAGIIPSSNPSCDVPFTGEYNCEGNPSIDLVGPVVKWDAIGQEEFGCAPGKAGMVILYFLSNVGPDPNSELSFFLIKNGLNVCQGTIIGDTPGPACMVPTEGKNWGAIKAIYD